MKRSIKILTMLAGLVACTPAVSNAQLFKEWFRQKKTQKEYLAQQIIALKAYGEFLQRGYGLIEDGTGLIRGFTNGEFNLHKDFFGSLKGVNPELLKSGKVEAILSMQQEMDRLRTNASGIVSGSEYLGAEEKQSVRKFLGELESGCEAELEELMMVLTGGKVELSDDERLARIDKSYKATQGIYALHRQLIPALLSLLDNKEKELRDLEMLKWMTGTDP